MPDRGSRGDVERRRVEPRNAQDGDVVARVERDRLRVEARLRPARQHARVVLAGDDVRVGDDDARPRRPSPSPRRRRRTRSRGSSPRCAPRRAHLAGRARSPARGGGTRACGPSMCGNGSSARERVEQRPGRRQHRVEPAQDRRALDVARGCPAPRCSATAPSTQATSSPTHAVSTAPSAPSTAAKAGERTRRAAARPPPRSPPPARRRPRSRRPARIAGAHARLAAAPSTSGAIRVPEPGAGGEADQRERAGDEALRPAEEREQHDRADDHPVDACQLCRAYGATTPLIGDPRP